MNLDISDATVEAWDKILMEAYDEDLPDACLAVLKRWETTFLPPPGVILQECQKQCHRRMKELDEEKRLDENPKQKRVEQAQAEGLARIARVADLIESKSS